MSIDLLVREARAKIAARDEAQRALEALQAEIDSVTNQQPEAHDRAATAKREWEAALAGNGKAAPAKTAFVDAKEKLEELEAREAGLQRRVEALEKDHAAKRSAAAVVIVRIAKVRATELAEETRRLARVVARNHAQWHCLARGAAAIAAEASGRQHEEPIAAQDPGASCLRGHRDRFDEGLEADFRAEGLGSGGNWWAPGGGLVGMNENEILAEVESK